MSNISWENYFLLDAENDDDEEKYDSVYYCDGKRPRETRVQQRRFDENVIDNPYYGACNDRSDCSKENIKMNGDPADFTAITRVNNIYYYANS